MWDNLRPALIIAEREIRDQFRDWRIIIPIFTLTLIFPGIMNFTASQAVRFVSQYGAQLVVERLVPFLLMVVGFFPISISMVIALESFVGEKERRSIEPLLTSPLKDWQLYVGKLVAVMLPPLIAGFLGIGVYLFGVWQSINWVAEPALLIQIVLLTFFQALVMVSGAVVISTQTTSVRAANLLASFIIIPVSFLIQAESMVMFWGQYNALWWINLGLVIIAGLLLRTGISHFNREELLGREMDVLNLRMSWRVFVNAFTGETRSIRKWYQEVGKLLWKMRFPILMLAVLVPLAVWVGMGLSAQFPLPAMAADVRTTDTGILEEWSSFGLMTPQGVPVIWWHNIRALLLGLVLATFSFGVLGILAIMIPFALIGYILGNITAFALTPAQLLLGFILPHGVFEIPAAIIAGAAMLYMGGKIAAPSEDGRTIGEALLISLGYWFRLFVGAVLPLLLLASVMEVLVTPRIALFLLGQ